MRKTLILLYCLTIGFVGRWPLDSAHGAAADPKEICARVVNDDTVRRYNPALKEGFLKAYHRVFPDADGEPDQAELKTSSFRCMDSHLVACFVGANLPCGKIDTSKRNRGATAYCRSHRHDEIVPMSATGHDTMYTFSCAKGKARVKEQTWSLDRRGFATEIWKPMD